MPKSSREQAVCKALAMAQGRRVEIVSLEAVTLGVLDRVEYSLSDPEASVIHLTGGCAIAPPLGSGRRREIVHQDTATVALLDVVAVYDLTGGKHVRIA